MEQQKPETVAANLVRRPTIGTKCTTRSFGMVPMVPAEVLSWRLWTKVVDLHPRRCNFMEYHRMNMNLDLKGE